jgi:hypothetical protein
MRLNGIALVINIALFFLAAPALLSVRFVRPKRLPWWLLGILAAVSGWVFSNLSVHFYYRHLYDLVIEAGGFDVAPPDLVDDWQADGAKRVFALLFGWLYGLVYLVPWLVLYGVFCLVRRSQ